MPIYEYQCRKCGKGFEHLARRLSEPVPACPACGAKNPRKQFSTFSASVAAGEPAAPPCASGACSTRRCPAAGLCDRH